MTDDISKVVREMAQCLARADFERAGELSMKLVQMTATTPAEVGEVDAAASNLNLAAVHAKPEHKPLIVGAIGLIRTLARQLAEAKERMRELEGFREYAELLKHKVITCGVAARHPDPSLSRTGAYAGKWNSPQAEDVRALRDRAEQAESQLAEATRRLGEVEGLLRECQRRLGAEESLRHMTYREWSELDDRIDAALTKEPTK